MKTNIALFGAAGKMGREILKLAAMRDDLHIVGAYDVHGIGEKIEGMTVQAVPQVLPTATQVVLDFSSAAALETNLALALKAQAAYVSGVTGFVGDPQAAFEQAAKTIPVLHSTNMSPAMNVLFALAGQAAQALPTHKRFISETHHTAKKDAPSGTALSIAAAIKTTTNEATAIQSLRLGDVVGEHQLIFSGPGERLEIIHRADSRSVFAAGALRAAAWLVGKKAGVYSMREVLGV